MNILIVDDSAGIRTVLALFLGELGVPVTKVLEAGDGVEALNLINNGQKVDLMFLDINMPNMGGIELLHHIRSSSGHNNWHSVPVFVITGGMHVEKVQEAQKLGASGFIRKPFNHGQIREQLEHVGISC